MAIVKSTFVNVNTISTLTCFGESIVAFAHVGPGFVRTKLITTSIVFQTLVNIYTLVPAGRERETIGTRALETSGIVCALAIGADTRVLQTLIDVIT